ncbi:hypothetical protein E2F46_14710 [Luteimonas aestuarii]|uniref:Uncharacterized protein n=1 Tax=Luteimonas aestuarii TaxID=453837 RepID=A0A4R5TRS7_9GAMM|nr:DUF6519 domain-containing protein [Luteimonas aestuarii]TDK21487.1 hypothetical protein E2F46_14710 [Luteimonas aestuarii]
MKGDFSRLTFDPRNRFSQVLQQQGRVMLDADVNEQGAILLHQLRTMALDLFGSYAAPAMAPGFGLSLASADGVLALRIGAGRYYVHGVLCENEGCDYLDQPHFTPGDGTNDEEDPLRHWLASTDRDGARFWIYLKVWERHVTPLEMPHLHEVALAGPDTCSRSQVVWQVRALDMAAVEASLAARLEALGNVRAQAGDAVEAVRLQAWIDALQSDLSRLRATPGQACAAPLRVFDRDAPKMALRLAPPGLDDPGVIGPSAGYRGLGNHLYRIEIHRPGRAGAATFKWSRDNGSVVTRWLSGGGRRLRVARTEGFAAGQWVELSDEVDDLCFRPGSFCQLAGVEGDELVLASDAPRAVGATSKVRRWDQQARTGRVLSGGAVPLDAASGSAADWIDLEDGVQVRFDLDGEYRTGDYWHVAMRTTGETCWERDADGEPLARAPHGPRVHYAPLGFVGMDDAGNPGVDMPCRRVVGPIGTGGDQPV